MTEAPSTELAVREQPPIPPPPPVSTPFWPGPRAAAGPVPAIAAVVAGVLAAALVPLGHIGIGWVLAGAAAAAAITISLAWPASRGRREPAGPPATHDPATHDPAAADPASTDPAPTDPAPTDRARTDQAPADQAPADQVPAEAGRRRAWTGYVEPCAWGLAALALLSVGALRAAGWLFGLSLAGAAVAIVLALTGGRTMHGLMLGTALMPAAAYRGLHWGQRGLSRLRRRVSPNVRIGPTAAITAAVVLIFGALFASADAAFSRLLGVAMPDLEFGSIVRWAFLFASAATLVLTAVFLLLAPPTLDEMASPRPRGVKLFEWAVPVGALVVLFASFVGVQLTVLFGGVTYVLGPDGPTYAEYARGGFWQLLVVTALTLLVIGVVALLAPRQAPLERWCLRGLLGALAALTLVIVASALFRMHTYQEAYGFTRLRVLVSLAELWLGLVFVLVLAAGVRLRARWLPRAVVATGIVALLALAVLNPDRFIAERNIDQWQPGKQLDTGYLADLSADAVPALVCLPEPERHIALSRFQAERADLSTSDWRRANLARSIAADLLADPPPDCPSR